MAREPSSAPLTYPSVNEDLLSDLKKGGYRTIALQVPAGLIPQAEDIAASIRSATNASVIQISRPCFGACDPPTPSEMLGADAFVALGHAPISNMHLRVPTYLAEMRIPPVNTKDIAAMIAKSDIPRRLGGVASIQHLDLLQALREELGPLGVQLYIGRGGRRLGYAGQALGCNYSSATEVEADVDGFVLLGTGTFHLLGLAYSVKKPVWNLDPLQKVLEGPVDRESLLKKRLLLIGKAMDARSWGVLVSTFSGQFRRSLALRLVEKADRKGLEASIITCDRLSPSDLEGRKLDAYVSTACPRIALDDGHLYPRPMLTPPEFLAAIGEKPMLPYRFDTFP
jgi:2-(3-amino-3-carboxypropyl)histidine synthase